MAKPLIDDDGIPHADLKAGRCGLPTEIDGLAGDFRIPDTKEASTGVAASDAHPWGVVRRGGERETDHGPSSVSGPSPNRLQVRERREHGRGVLGNHLERRLVICQSRVSGLSGDRRRVAEDLALADILLDPDTELNLHLPIDGQGWDGDDPHLAVQATNSSA